MAEKTEISWCDATWSPWEGCTKISPGCDGCYAAAMNGWLRKGQNWGPGAPRRLYSDAHWQRPLTWQNRLAKKGERMSCFPSVCDPLDNEAPDGGRERFWTLVDNTPNIDWLILTKRIGNAKRMLPARWLVPGGWPANVRIGITVVNQEEVDRDLPKLLALGVPNFISYEPALGPINLRDVGEDRDEWAYTMNALTGVADAPGFIADIMPSKSLDWVIAGGESGRKARPAQAEWFRSVRDQCAAADVPFHFKQWGEWAPATGDDVQNYGTDRIVSWPGGPMSVRAGKKRTGSLLDGREHVAFPRR